MKMVTAALQDQEHIMALLEACVANMRAKEIYQWNEIYPNADIMVQDIQSKTLFIMKNDQEYYGIITLNEDQEKEYDTVKWQYEGKILVIHRLAINPAYEGQGIGSKIMAFAENYGKEKGYDAIRFDTYSGNPRAVRFYKHLGFEKVGQVFFPYRELPFYCYEKKLTRTS